MLPPRRGYADQARSLKLSKALRVLRALLRIRVYIRLADAFQGKRRTRGRSGLQRRWVVFIRYPRPPRCRPGCLLGWWNPRKSSVPETKIGPFSFVRWCAKLAFANHRQCGGLPMQASEIHDYASRLLKHLRRQSPSRSPPKGLLIAKSAAIKSEAHQWAANWRRAQGDASDRTSADPCKPLLRLALRFILPFGHVRTRQFRINFRLEVGTGRDAGGDEFRRSHASAYS